VDKPQPITEETADGVRRGDPDAVGECYRALVGPLTSWIRSQVRDAGLAEDIATETFLKLVRGSHSIEGGPFAIRSWLYRVAQRNILDHKRARDRRIDEELTDDTPERPATDVTPDHYVLQGERAAHMNAALSELSEDQRQVLTLRFVAELSAPEVAEILGKTEGAVRALQHRGAATLARILRRTGQAEEPVPMRPPRTTERVPAPVAVPARRSAGG